MEFITLNDQPFSLVKDVVFQRLPDHFERRYTKTQSSLFFQRSPTRATLPILFSDPYQVIDDNVTSISLTTDIWTSDASPVSIFS